ncbi:MAG: hypothetical protein U0800_20335 [Isosphaeraceae bacterium]
MSSRQISSEIASVVQEFFDDLKQFTLYDVTQEVRRRVGRNVTVNHRDVHDEIEGVVLAKMQDNPAWARDLIHPPGASRGVQAYVYHHVRRDPDDYAKGDA